MRYRRGRLLRPDYCRCRPHRRLTTSYGGFSPFFSTLVSVVTFVVPCGVDIVLSVVDVDVSLQPTRPIANRGTNATVKSRRFIVNSKGKVKRSVPAPTAIRTLHASDENQQNRARIEPPPVASTINLVFSAANLTAARLTKQGFRGVRSHERAHPDARAELQRQLPQPVHGG